LFESVKMMRSAPLNLASELMQQKIGLELITRLTGGHEVDEASAA